MPTSEEQRFADLETKLVFQERMIEQLNDALLEAHGNIRACQQRIDQLETRINDLGGGGGTEIVDVRPPHY